jgi:hypothetical protein
MQERKRQGESKRSNTRRRILAGRLDRPEFPQAKKRQTHKHNAIMSSPSKKPTLKLAIGASAAAHCDSHQDQSHLTIPSQNSHVKDYAEESDIHPEISVDLKFSDSHTIHLRLKTGDTVQNIKKRLEAEHNMPYSKTSLSLHGQQMLDPLSLNDFAAVNEAVQHKRNVVIDVQV